jgi:hypothetical protein
MSKNGYANKKSNRTGDISRRGQNSLLGVHHPDPVHFDSRVTSTRSPFGDSNEDVRGPSQESEHNGIQVHKTFEIQTGEDKEGHEMSVYNVSPRT